VWISQWRAILGREIAWELAVTHLSRIVIALLCVVAGVTSAAAQSYPSRPIRMIVPFSPGGPSDILARLLGSKLTEAWGQPVVVDNRPGASGMIGTELTVKAPPDGYTLILSNLADAISVGLYPKLPYDILRDLKQVCVVSISPFILVAHPSAQVRSLDELIARARAKPGELSFASGGGVGVPSHMAGELLKWRAKIDLLHVPYKGQGPATADLLAGHVPLMFVNAMNGLPSIREGRLNAIGVSMPQRIPSAPDIPTLSESGLPGFDVGIWFGIQAPAATPDEIVRRIAGEMRRILDQPEVRAALAAQGAEPLFEGPEAYAARIRADIAKWTEVIKAADIRPE
jgi:tripartite-type tricarboxylate transporter receptor subunit TctC